MEFNNYRGGPPSRKRRYYEDPLHLHEDGGPSQGPPPGRGRGRPGPGPLFHPGHGYGLGLHLENDRPFPPYSQFSNGPRPQFARPPPPPIQPPPPPPVQGPEATTNLIVNYLPQTLADEELHEIFSPCGEISSLRIVRDKNSGYSFGYGFVRYMLPSSASMAITALNGLQVLNKTIKVSYARPTSEDIKDTNLYITNLPRTMTDLDLVRMFAPFGEIVQKHILYDKYTQLPRGVAFVRYDRREQANAAIEALNGFIPPGTEEPLKVRLAENHGKQKASYVAGFQAGQQKRF